MLLGFATKLDSYAEGANKLRATRCGCAENYGVRGTPASWSASSAGPDDAAEPAPPPVEGALAPLAAVAGAAPLAPGAPAVVAGFVGGIVAPDPAAALDFAPVGVVVVIAGIVVAAPAAGV